MEYSDAELFGIVSEIDSLGIEVSDRDAEFIESILDMESAKLSPKQRQWILDMKERYMI